MKKSGNPVEMMGFPDDFYLQKKLLLQGLLNSNSHGNGHADHGVVACAQEASEAGLPVGKNPEKK